MLIKVDESNNGRIDFIITGPVVPPFDGSTPVDIMPNSTKFTSIQIEANSSNFQSISCIKNTNFSDPNSDNSSYLIDCAMKTVSKIFVCQLNLINTQNPLTSWRAFKLHKEIAHISDLKISQHYVIGQIPSPQNPTSRVKNIIFSRKYNSSQYQYLSVETDNKLEFSEQRTPEQLTEEDEVLLRAWYKPNTDLRALNQINFIRGKFEIDKVMKMSSISSSSKLTFKSGSEGQSYSVKFYEFFDGPPKGALAKILLIVTSLMLSILLVGYFIVKRKRAVEKEKIENGEYYLSDQAQNETFTEDLKRTFKPYPQSADDDELNNDEEK